MIFCFRRPYGIDTINSVELRRTAGLLCGINSKFKSNESPFKSDNFKNKMQRLNQIHSAYTRMKIALREDPNCPNTSLTIAADNFPKMLKEIYDPSAKHVEQETEKGNILEDDDGKTIGSRRKQLRDKFFSQEGMSHREQNVSKNSGRALELKGIKAGPHNRNCTYYQIYYFSCFGTKMTLRLNMV